MSWNRQGALAFDKHTLSDYYISMASRFALKQKSLDVLARADLARRVELARQPRPEDVRGPHWRRVLAELVYLVEPLARPFRRVEVAPATNPRVVMILPGFATHPVRMRYLARHLERAGHVVKRWGQGVNFGPTPENLEALGERVLTLHAAHGQKVVLVGWSLGGLFARELARRHPEAIAKVITMGSPFSGNPRANNAWRAYQFVTGHSVDEPPIEADFQAKPPVETVAMWSPRDGVVSPRCAAGNEHQRDRAVALRCSHMGFTYSREVIHSLLCEFDRS